MTQIITVPELREMLERGVPITVVDIRRAADRAEWFIPGSIHFEAYDRLGMNDPDAMNGVALPTDAPVVTVCMMGKTSVLAARQLEGQGLKAMSLEGGMRAWTLAWYSAPVSVGGSGAKVIQVRRTGKGCLSYIIGADGVAAVIDPSVDPQVYVNLATRNGWKITTVFDTHVHADHLSRSRRLAEMTGGSHYLPETDRVTFDYHATRDGDEVELGPVLVKALRTPGHTEESTSFLLDDRALFTGDTLFLDGVGRPDLEVGADHARTRAHALFGSLQEIQGLLQETVVLPCHTADPTPFDGRALAAPLSEVRERVDLLRIAEPDFVEQILARIPPNAPPNSRRIVELNEAGELPEGAAVDLEAGANRCAVS